jgi:hypothetical protein
MSLLEKIKGLAEDIYGKLKLLGHCPFKKNKFRNGLLMWQLLLIIIFLLLSVYQAILRNLCCNNLQKSLFFNWLICCRTKNVFLLTGDFLSEFL